MKIIEEQIEVMQYFANGGKIECCFLRSHNWSEVTTQDYLFNFREFKYRIKEQKKTITIEKWLIQKTIYAGNECLEIIEGNKTLFDSYYDKSVKIKLLGSYEVEL